MTNLAEKLAEIAATLRKQASEAHQRRQERHEQECKEANERDAELAKQRLPHLCALAALKGHTSTTWLEYEPPEHVRDGLRQAATTLGLELTEHPMTRDHSAWWSVSWDNLGQKSLPANGRRR